MKLTIHTIAAILVIAAATACSSSQNGPVKVVKPEGKTYVPTGK